MKFGKTQRQYLLRVWSVAVCPRPVGSGDVYGRGECSEYLNEAPPAVPCYKWSLYSAGDGCHHHLVREHCSVFPYYSWCHVSPQFGRGV